MNEIQSNQRVCLQMTKHSSSSILQVTSLQNKSTPGVYYRCTLNSNCEYIVKLIGIKQTTDKGTVHLWIGDIQKETIYLSKESLLEDKLTTILFRFYNNNRTILHVGALFDKPTNGDVFKLYTLTIMKLKNNVTSAKGIPPNLNSIQQRKTNKILKATYNKCWKNVLSIVTRFTNNNKTVSTNNNINCGTTSSINYNKTSSKTDGTNCSTTGSTNCSTIDCTTGSTTGSTTDSTIDSTTIIMNDLKHIWYILLRFEYKDTYRNFIFLDGVRILYKHERMFHRAIKYSRMPIIDSIKSFKPEAVLEAGAGWGKNIYYCFMHGVPTTIDYYGLELTNTGLRTMEAMLQYAPQYKLYPKKFDFDSPKFNLNTNYDRILLFTMWSIKEITWLNKMFFYMLLDTASHVMGIHLEPIGWQIKNTGQVYEYYNRNLYSLLLELQDEGRIHIVQKSVDMIGFFSKVNTASMLIWEKLPVHSFVDIHNL